MSKIVITGAASGLGAELTQQLHSAGHDVLPYDITYDKALDVLRPMVTWGEALDVLINCAGVNKIEWLENVTDEDWDAVVNTNAKGIFKMTQAALPALIKARGTVLNVVSNAAHMPMTCSLAYNASKGAAHIMTLQLARELTKKYGITVFGIAPNKLLGTGMSASIDEQVVKTRGWTPEFAHQYQINGLLTGEETPPAAVAEFVTFLLASKARHKFLSGCIIPYGA